MPLCEFVVQDLTTEQNSGLKQSLNVNVAYINWTSGRLQDRNLTIAENITVAVSAGDKSWVLTELDLIKAVVLVAVVTLLYYSPHVELY